MKSRLYYGADPEPGPSAFFWPGSPSKREEMRYIKRTNPNQFESVYQCRPGSRQGSIFLPDDLNNHFMLPPYLARGAGSVDAASFLGRFQALVTAWDTQFEATSESDFTCAVTAGLLPCDRYHRGEDPLVVGPCDPHLDVYLLDLYHEKVEWGDLVKAFRTNHNKWYPTIHVVEKRASGISLYQSFASVGINIEGVVSNESKRSRALMGTEAGSVQGWFRQHRVWLPRDAVWLEDYVKQMKDFTGADDSHDDQVDATVHLVNYAIQLGSGVALMSSEWTPEVVDQIMAEQGNVYDEGFPNFPRNRDAYIHYVEMGERLSEDPYAATCSKCDHNNNRYCEVQRRLVVGFDSCEYFRERGTDA